MGKRSFSESSGSTTTLTSRPAHSLPYDAVVKELKSNINEGLSHQEAKHRLEQYGPNKLDDDEGVSVTNILLRQVANAMTLVSIVYCFLSMIPSANPAPFTYSQVLIMGMAVSFGIQSWVEGGFITAIILVNVVVGFFQEFAAEKTLESLHSLSSPTGVVSRNGTTQSVPSADIVPGDMVELKTGDTVPSDLRYVTCTFQMFLLHPLIKCFFARVID